MEAENASCNDPDIVIIPKQEVSFFDSKLFKCISICLYLGGISGLGMVLSFYYILFFDSTMPDIHIKYPVSINGRPLQRMQEFS